LKKIKPKLKTMKHLKLFAIAAIIGFAAFSCKSPTGDRATTGDAMTASELENYEAYQVNLDESVVEWIGTKPTGQHNGTTKLSEGVLKINDGQIVGGKFTIDLTSIVVLDITDPEMNARLLGHLKSEDFFEVETWPTAEFEILTVDVKGDAASQAETGVVPTHTISGNLTMKGITKSVKFDAQVEMMEDLVSAKTVRFLIDRTDWNVNYGSNKVFDNLKDNFIHDDMALTIKLVAEK
jgi:polyisoprenoid-binding protein YceI